MKTQVIFQRLITCHILTICWNLTVHFCCPFCQQWRDIEIDPASSRGLFLKFDTRAPTAPPNFKPVMLVKPVMGAPVFFYSCQSIRNTKDGQHTDDVLHLRYLWREPRPWVRRLQVKHTILSAFTTNIGKETKSEEYVQLCTGWSRRIWHRKLKETKVHPSNPSQTVCLTVA